MLDLALREILFTPNLTTVVVRGHAPVKYEGCNHWMVVKIMVALIFLGVVVSLLRLRIILFSLYLLF